MAINSPGQQPGAASTANPSSLGSAFANSAQQTAHQYPSSADDGFGSLTSYNKKSGNGGFQETYRKMADLVENKLDPQLKERMPIYLVAMDTSLPRWNTFHAPAIIAIGIEDGNAYYTAVVFQDPSKDPGVKEVTVANGAKITMHMTDMDCYDGTYQSEVDAIAKEYLDARSIKYDRLVGVMGGLVSAKYEKTDDNIVELLRNNVINVLKSAHLEFLQSVKQPMNLLRVSVDNRFESSVAYAQPPIVEKTNETVHSARFVLGVSKVGENKKQSAVISLNDGTSRVPLTYCAGFIDVVPTNNYVGTPEASNLQPIQYGDRRNDDAQLSSHVMLTAMDSHTLNTLQVQLLSLGSVALHFTNTTNILACMLAHSSDEEQLNNWNPAGLNYLANIGKDPSGKGPYIKDFYTLPIVEQAKTLRKMVNENVMFSLRISRLGQDSFYNNVFFEAAIGKPEAQERIVQAANALTGSKLAEVLNGQAIVPMRNVVSLVPLGHYVDSSGTKRDLADVNLISILNRAGRSGHNPDDDIQAYLSAISGEAAQDHVTRLETLRNIYKSVLGGSVVFSGTGYVVTFNGDFIMALCEAIKRTGKAPILTNGGTAALNTARYTMSYASDNFAKSYTQMGGYQGNSGGNNRLPGFATPGMRSF